MRRPVDGHLSKASAERRHGGGRRVGLRRPPLSLAGLFLCVAVGAATPITKSGLKAKILAEYGLASIRPGEKAAEKAAAAGICPAGTVPPEDVQVQIYVDQYIPLDLKGQTYGFSGYLRTWWNDPSLAYNGTADGGCADELGFTPDEHSNFWRPRFYWEDAKKVTFPGPSDGELFIVYPSGNIWWSRQVSFLLNCPFAKGNALDMLPFDTQRCVYRMGMYAETAFDVKVKWKEGRVALSNWQGVCMAEWSTTELNQKDEVWVYSSANYTYAAFTLDFARFPSSWLWSFLMPALVTVCLSYLGFYIDPAATPARVALGMITCHINMTNFSSLINAVPPTAQPPWLTRFVLNSFFFNVAAMMEQIIVSFGNSAHKWLEAQRKDLEVYMPWRDALRIQRVPLEHILSDWDKDGNGALSKQEFRHGVQAVGIRAPLHEVNRLFDSIDIDGDGQITKLELSQALAKQAAAEAAEAPAEPAPAAAADGSDAASAILEYETRLAENMNFEANGQIAEAQHRLPAIARKASKASPAPTALAAPGGPADAAPETQLNISDFMTSKPSEHERDHKAPKATDKRATAALRKQYQRLAARDMDKGPVWRFKTFTLFPILSGVRNLDHYCRWLYPCAYAVYVLTTFSGIGFAAPHMDKLLQTECFRLASGAP